MLEVQACVSLSGFLCLWYWGPNSGPPAGTVSALSHWDFAFCSKVVWCYQHIGRESSSFKTGAPGGHFRRYCRGLMLTAQEKVKTIALQVALSGAGALQGWGFPNRIRPFVVGSHGIHPPLSQWRHRRKASSRIQKAFSPGYNLPVSPLRSPSLQNSGRWVFIAYKPFSLWHCYNILDRLRQI